MNPPTKIVIINKSSAPGLAAALPAIVDAIGKQLANDVSPVWGLVPALAVGEAPEPDASTITITDTLDVDGALGYHDEAGGIPRGFVGTQLTLDNGGTISSGPNSISVTLSHEILEMVGDESANLWADAPDGSDYARELCDAVEGDSYDVEGIAVSNFVYPAFFDGQADATEKLDQLGKLKQPFTMTGGGYQIKRSEPGAISQVTAERASSIRIVAHHQGRVVSASFGSAYPAWRIPGKIAKLRKRLARASKRAAA